MVDLVRHSEEDNLISDIAKRISIEPMVVRNALAIMERHERLATIHADAGERTAYAIHEYSAYAWRRVATDAPVISPHLFDVSRQIHRMAIRASQRSIKSTLRAISKRTGEQEVTNDGNQLA